MLSMINPDTISRFEQQNRFATSAGGQISNKGSQDHFYPPDEMEEHMHTLGSEGNGGKRPQHNHAVKTQNNFYHA